MPETRKPRNAGARGALKINRAGRPTASELTDFARGLQVRRLICRFGWSEARARVVAELAFHRVEGWR